MNSNNNAQFDTWYLKTIATSISAALKQRFGLKDHYSPDDVSVVCDELNAQGYTRACALALFSRPEEIEQILKGYGISDPTVEFRKMMTKKLSYSHIPGSETGTFMGSHSTQSNLHHYSDLGADFGSAGSDGGGGD